VIKACSADIAVLQEATDPTVVKKVASACGMQFSGATRGDSVAFLSRIEVAEYRWHYTFAGRRRFMEIVPAAGGVRIFGVHLSAIHSNLTEWRRTLEIRLLLSRLQEYRNTFHLVIGDFNTLAAGEELDLGKLPIRLRALYWMLGGKIRWKTISLMVQGGYRDIYRALHPEDPGHTFPTHDPHVRLDYLFTPNQFIGRVARCEVMRDLPGVREASDHFPLLAEINN
jgi:endonuclease/exonuclease/phosphatase family metal-dependent hydrolase